jgi:P27 family predicted phage terminase small subunit
MARGRKPRPIELRQAEGNPGRRPLPEPLRTGAPLAAEPPPLLGAPGRELWREMVDQLGSVGALGSIDRVVLTAFCLQWDELIAAQAVLNEQGRYVVGPTGQLLAHPALKVQAQAAKLLLACASELAATPVARARLAAAKQQERRQAEFEELTAGTWDGETAEIDGELL